MSRPAGRNANTRVPAPQVPVGTWFPFFAGRSSRPRGLGSPPPAAYPLHACRPRSPVIPSTPPTFFFTAAEHSGDALGGALIPALRETFPDARFVGVGGPKMAKAGCRMLADPTARSSMLVGALFSQATYWWQRLREIEHEFRAAKPTVHIPIDSSAINLRIAARARAHGIPVCYYVAPQVWASRPWRVKKIAKVVDTLCCVYPFEEAYFKERGVNAVYVGHPMFDTPADTPETDPARLDPPLPAAEPRVALMPGSRRFEIDANLPGMLAVVAEIKGRYPRCSLVAVAPSEERAWQIRHHLRKSNTPVDIRVGVADAVIRWADLVIVKSGTGVLQVARHHKPMVVVYAVAGWKWAVGKHLIHTPFIAIANILAGRELVPEFVPFRSPPAVAREVLTLLAHPEQRAVMARDLAALTAPLGPGGGKTAAARVAAEIAKLVP